MRRKIAYIAAALVLLVAAGCSPIQKIKNIKVTSAALESLSPNGLRSLDIGVLLGIDNPAMQFTAEDISGTIYRLGEPYVDFTVEPITVKARTAGVYELNASAALRPEISLMTVLGLARNYDLAEFTADVDVTVKLRSGVGKALKIKNINIKELLE